MAAIDPVDEIINYDRSIRLCGFPDESLLINLPVGEMKTRKLDTKYTVLKSIYYHETRRYPYCFKQNPFPQFKKFDMSNILIAGGAVISSYRDITINDYDIFIYGTSNPRAVLDRVTEHLVNLSPQNTVVYRTKFTVTIVEYRDEHRKHFANKYQIILRCYNSKSHILHGFDLPCCAVGWDGNFYTTKAGLFSLTHNVNILDLTRRSVTYENRLIKYYYRGFALVLPNFKIDLRRKYYELPYLKIEIKVTSDFVSSHLTNKQRINQGDYVMQDIFTPSVITAINIKALKDATYDKFIYYNDEIFIDMKYITNRLLNIANYIIEKRVINLNVLQFYYPDESPSVFLGTENEIKEAYHRQRRRWPAKIKQINKTIPKSELKFNTTNPTTQAIGSFNPAIITEKEWYGQFYREINVDIDSSDDDGEGELRKRLVKINIGEQ